MIGNHRILAISSLFTSAFLYAEASVVTNFTTTKTDPTNISIPNIPQTTSYDVATECTYYTSPYTINQAEWPTIWDIATTNGMNTSQEFQNLYNSINWSQAPNIQVRTMSAAGGLDMTGYDTVNDPDCWWSATQCVKPKHQGINPDISACPEPETWGLVSSLSSFFLTYYPSFSPFTLLFSSSLYCCVLIRCPSFLDLWWWTQLFAQCVLWLFATKQPKGDHVLYRLECSQLALRCTPWSEGRSSYCGSHLVS